MSRKDSEYYTGEKNQWRRCMWKRIAAKSNASPKESIAIYLGAKNDLDRDVAIANGFKDYNLICVERDAASINSIRRGGAPCIKGDFFDAVQAAAINRRIDVVFGDLMCGLEFDAICKIIFLMHIPSLEKCVFAFNFLRGRDSSSNEIRHRFSKYLKEPFRKHRGALMVLLAKNDVLHRAKVGQFRGVPESLLNDSDFADKICGFPILFSYKSDPQIFDSAIFRNPMEYFQSEKREAWFEDHYKPLIKDSVNRNCLRSASAIFAHRTMRINGTFPEIRRR